MSLWDEQHELFALHIVFFHLPPSTSCVFFFSFSLRNPREKLDPLVFTWSPRGQGVLSCFFFSFSFALALTECSCSSFFFSLQRHLLWIHPLEGWQAVLDFCSSDVIDQYQSFSSVTTGQSFVHGCAGRSAWFRRPRSTPLPVFSQLPHGGNHPSSLLLLLLSCIVPFMVSKVSLHNS